MSDYISFPFLCFGCRRSFKIDCSDCAWRHEWGIDERGAEKKARPCPLCGQMLIFGGAYVRTPPQGNLRRWKALELLVRNGWRDEYLSSETRRLLRNVPEIRKWVELRHHLAHLQREDYAKNLKIERKKMSRAPK